MKIRKILVAVISLFMAAALLTGCGTASSTSGASDLPVIKLGSDSYPPYNYLDEDGNPTGIDVELATEAFARMGYRVEIVQIDWEKKKELVESGAIDCIMGCFSMEGRLDDYQWAGPYIASRQVVAVNESSDIYTLQDLAGKNLAVQSTTKPEGIFLKRTDERIPKLGNLISLGHRELIFTFLEKGYAEKIMFGHDKYNKLGGFYGGAYGYTRFPTFAIPALREMGYEKEAQLITVANPARFLSHS